MGDQCISNPNDREYLSLMLPMTFMERLFDSGGYSRSVLLETVFACLGRHSVYKQ